MDGASTASSSLPGSDCAIIPGASTDGNAGIVDVDPAAAPATRGRPLPGARARGLCGGAAARTVCCER